MKEKLKFLKLLNEFRTLDYELQYIKEVLKEGHLEFEEYYRVWCAENDVDLTELNKQNQQKIEAVFEKIESSELSTQVIQKLEANKREFKKIFKEIAKKLHPDKIDNDDPRKWEYSEAFKKAMSARSEAKWGELFDIVDKYEIWIGEYDEAIESLREDIGRVDMEIKREKSTYSWLLQEAETDADKELVVKAFLRQLFGWKG